MRLAIGEIVYYCGEHCWQQYKETPLILHQQRDNQWICRKPDGYLTTDLPVRELSRSLVDKPTVKRVKTLHKAEWLKEWEKNDSIL
jgi:hypothetical protein